MQELNYYSQKKHHKVALNSYFHGALLSFILRAVECLNLIGWRTFWSVQLFSGKRTANVVPGSSLDCITWPYLFEKFCYFKGLTTYFLQQRNKTIRVWNNMYVYDSIFVWIVQFLHWKARCAPLLATQNIQYWRYSINLWEENAKL